MLGSDVSVAVVGVSEVEWFAGLDWCTASCAWDWASGEYGGPACPLYLVGVSVSALGGGASGAVGFPLVCGAVAFAGVDEGWAAGLRAWAFCHVVTPFGLAGRYCGVVAVEVVSFVARNAACRVVFGLRAVCGEHAGLVLVVQLVGVHVVI